MPHASTFTRTQSACGSGISRSTISSGPRGCGTCTARIFFAIIFYRPLLPKNKAPGSVPQNKGSNSCLIEVLDNLLPNGASWEAATWITEPNGKSESAGSDRIKCFGVQTQPRLFNCAKAAD